MDEPLFENLLVPIAGSKESVDAGRLAFHIAREQRAQVTLLHVIDLEVLEQSAAFSEKPKSEVLDRMKREGESHLEYLAKIAQEYEIDAKRELREGDPYEEIVDLANEIRADLIVMGHVGRRGPRRRIIGSVAERVIRFASCPVLVFKE